METEAKTLCRRDGPETSREAAEKIVKSGELNAQEDYIYDEIVGYITRRKSFNLPDNFTTKDIARRMEDVSITYDKAYDICRKRFSGLERKGKIELVYERDWIFNKRRDGCRVWRLK